LSNLGARSSYRRYRSAGYTRKSRYGSSSYRRSSRGSSYRRYRGKKGYKSSRRVYRRSKRRYNKRRGVNHFKLTRSKESLRLPPRSGRFIEYYSKLDVGSAEADFTAFLCQSTMGKALDAIASVIAQVPYHRYQYLNDADKEVCRKYWTAARIKGLMHKAEVLKPGTIYENRISQIAQRKVAANKVKEVVERQAVNTLAHSNFPATMTRNAGLAAAFISAMNVNPILDTESGTKRFRDEGEMDELTVGQLNA